MGMDGKILKGSFTVEAALISGLWLFTIFAALLLILGEYQRIYDTGKAYEAAVRGASQAVCASDSTEAAVDQEAGFWTARDKETIQVGFQNSIQIPFSDLEWNQEGRAERKIIKPVVFIETVNAARRLAGNLIR